MNFEEFKQKRYSTRPWDFDYNPLGFRSCGPETSDISAHLPLLELLAGYCTHCTEFGVRDAFSTSALIAGCKGKVISYDILPTGATKELSEMELPCKWEFKIANTATLEKIESTDLLFIDTLHTYEQVMEELKHANSVRKWIVFHDTYSQGELSLDIPGRVGITKAIDEFLATNPRWTKLYEVTFNHGLLVLGQK